LDMDVTIDSVYHDGTNAVRAAYHIEPWMTKQQLANHLGMSIRWVEMRVRDGMPMMRFGSRPRFRASQVEDWISKQAKGTRQ
jgi:excisionase family DNA binding protein